MLKKSIHILLIISIIGGFILGMVKTAYAANNRLTAIEIAGLQHMREEEKLARDVYIFFYNKYGLSIFDNISHSEQNHTNAVLNLLNYYGLPDPASTQLGIFNNQELQALYNACITRGSVSLSEAIKTGGAIEEIDIQDLRFYISQTSKSNIQQVYGNLLNGSYHHLRAFSSSLFNLTGEIYIPQYLSQADYDAIIGGGGGGGGGGCRRCGR